MVNWFQQNYICDDGVDEDAAVCQIYQLVQQWVEQEHLRKPSGCRIIFRPINVIVYTWPESHKHRLTRMDDLKAYIVQSDTMRSLQRARCQHMPSHSPRTPVMEPPTTTNDNQATIPDSTCTTVDVPVQSDVPPPSMFSFSPSSLFSRCVLS